MKTHICFTLVLGLCMACAPAGSNHSQPSASANTAASASATGSSLSPQADFETTGEDVKYHPQKQGFSGYLAQPKTPGKYPALVLIHEWWGLNKNIREFADHFAQKGYVALAVDLYEGQSTDKPEEARNLAAAVRNNLAAASDNLTQGVNFLKAQSMVNSERVASVGWCFGGGWSYEMAKNNMGVKASVMYYGSFNDHDDLSQMKAHILGHFGEKDTSIKLDDVRQFQATLKTLSGSHEIYIYPNAGHGFANSDNPAAYNKEAADLAWERTLSFLKGNL